MSYPNFLNQHLLNVSVVAVPENVSELEMEHWINLYTIANNKNIQLQMMLNELKNKQLRLFLKHSFFFLTVIDQQPF